MYIYIYIYIYSLVSGSQNVGRAARWQPPIPAMAEMPCFSKTGLIPQPVPE